MDRVRNNIAIITEELLTLGRIKAIMRTSVILLGGLHAWAAAASHAMNPDGVSYLDIGDAYMRGDWNTVINSVWSPMYSWILGPVLYFVKPTMRWEFPLVHLLNFIIYLCALICFEYFWRQLTLYRQSHRMSLSGEICITLPDKAWLILGYILFIISSLHLIEIWAVTPDMLMSAFVYLSAGLIIRIRMKVDTWHTFIMLGVLLGLSYLAKAVMFPLAFVFLFVTVLSMGNLRRAAPRVLVSLFIFLLFSMPFIGILSITKGKFTYSDIGKLVYAWHVNGLQYPHWQGDPPGNGRPLHPSKRIHDNPPIYEFGTPLRGTYPISLDPSYWYEGLLINFNLKNQIKSYLESIAYYFGLFFNQYAGVVFGVLLLYFISSPDLLRLTDIVQRLGLVFPALTVFGGYGSIHVEGRYIGAFVLLFWTDLLANIRVPDFQSSRRILFHLSSIMIIFMLLNIVFFNLQGFRDIAGLNNMKQIPISQDPPPSWPGEVAEELHQLGVEPGDKVAVIGYALDSFWARLARVKIVAEMLGTEADSFWVGGPEIQGKALRSFASTGVKAVVAEYVPRYASIEGWHRVGISSYYIYVFVQ
jgi:hypothetical protein